MSNSKRYKTSQCQVCGKPLSVHFKGDICSDACRQKKTRMKRDAGKILLRIQRDCETLISAMDLGLIDLWDSYDAYSEVYDKVAKMHDMIDALHHKPE